ncbi:MAG TPA: flagellar hook-associated protein FlgL [Planctomycetota bacterium]|nr:flagellar hook-associated protein FlgL [Planctomycetota bacterium]
MNIRPTQASTFALVQNGLLSNFGKLVSAQEQVSSGKKFLRASDDPGASARALALQGRVSETARYVEAIAGGTRELGLGATALQDAGELITQAKEITLAGLNGTLSAEDRAVLALQLRQIKAQLLDIANTNEGGRYLFSGTDVGSKPFETGDRHGFASTAYGGNQDQHQLLVGGDLHVAIGIPGSDIFAGFEPAGASFEGLTGASNGTSTDQGLGPVTLFVRHDSTTLTIPGGVALVAAGANDTLIGNHTLAIDPVAGTVTLDAGPPRQLPAAGSANFADFELTNDRGDTVHLDFSAWSGAAANGTVVGAGSMSLDQTTWTAIDGVSTDVELVDASTNTVLHVDVTAIHRSGNELVSFTGTVNIFDALESIADTLENVDGLSASEQVRRVNLVFDEVDRNHDNVLAGLTTLGARSARMQSLDENYAGVDTELRSQISNIEDADYSQVVLDMMRAEQTLQLTQSVGSKLLQTTLLNFLR